MAAGTRGYLSFAPRYPSTCAGCGCRCPKSWKFEAGTWVPGCKVTSLVDCIIARKLKINVNLSSNHIQCLCHKIAFIILAGLKAIGTDTDGLTQSKQSTLGFVPELLPIAKESGGVTQEVKGFRS
ncbi:hypothetical protein PTTG_10220, partial [Puccinia triticina 1-1 BBBD Race 1]